MSLIFQVGAPLCLFDFAFAGVPPACDKPPEEEEDLRSTEWGWLRDSLPVSSSKIIHMRIPIIDSKGGTFCTAWACYVGIGLLLSFDASSFLCNSIEFGDWETCWYHLSQLLTWVDSHWQFAIARIIARIQTNYQLACKTDELNAHLGISNPTVDKERHFLETVREQLGDVTSEFGIWYTFFPYALNLTATNMLLSSAARTSFAWAVGRLAASESLLDELLLGLDCQGLSCSDCLVPWMGNNSAKFKFCRGAFCRDHILKKVLPLTKRSMQIAWTRVFRMSFKEVLQSEWPLVRSITRILRKLVSPREALCDMYRAEAFPSINLGALRDPSSIEHAPELCSHGRKLLISKIARAKDVRENTRANGQTFSHRDLTPVIPWPRRSKFLSMRHISSGVLKWSEFATPKTRLISQEWIRFSGVDELELQGGTTCGNAASIVQTLVARLPHLFQNDARKEHDPYIRILDVAAGAGQVSSEFMRQVLGASVIAFGGNINTFNIDNLDWMILAEHGPSYFGHVIRPDVAFPLASNGFDLIYCCECHLTLDPSDAKFSPLHIKELGRLLRLEGVFVVSSKTGKTRNYHYYAAAANNALASSNLYKMNDAGDVGGGGFLYFEKRKSPANHVQGPLQKQVVAESHMELVDIISDMLKHIPWEAGLHTRFLDAHALGSRGALGKALRRHENFSSSSAAARATHVAWQVAASDEILTELAEQGLVGFSAPCIKLPLRENSFDVALAVRLDHFVQHTCIQKGALVSLFEQMDFACRAGGLILLEAPDAFLHDDFLGGWHIEAVLQLSSYRIGIVIRKRGINSLQTEKPLA